jgi:hypothetical protein
MFSGIFDMNIMNQVQFAGEDEDDMYSGFNDYNATLDTQVKILILAS